MKYELGEKSVWILHLAQKPSNRWNVFALNMRLSHPSHFHPSPSTDTSILFYHIIKSEPIETTENCSISLLVEANKSKYVDNCTQKLIVFTGIYLVMDQKEASWTIQRNQTPIYWYPKCLYVSMHQLLNSVLMLIFVCWFHQIFASFMRQCVVWVLNRCNQPNGGASQQVIEMPQFHVNKFPMLFLSFLSISFEIRFYRLRSGARDTNDSTRKSFPFHVHEQYNRNIECGKPTHTHTHREIERLHSHTPDDSMFRRNESRHVSRTEN